MKTWDMMGTHHPQKQRRASRIAGLIVLCALGIGVTGCADGVPDGSENPSQPPLVADDVAALLQVESAAIATADKGDPTTNAVECWIPSEHLVESPTSDTVFRILCRLHYDDDSGPRYLDLTCIGDFELTPMLDHCYPWLPYSEVPRFEDEDAVWASDARP